MKTVKEPYIYKGLVTRVVDGDTVDIAVDVGFRMTANIRFRIRGFDAPEITRPSSPEELVAGRIAKNFAVAILSQQTVTVKSYKEAVYNRWDADIILPGGEDFATMMIQAGHVKNDEI